MGSRSSTTSIFSRPRRCCRMLSETRAAPRASPLQSSCTTDRSRIFTAFCLVLLERAAAHAQHDVLSARVLLDEVMNSFVAMVLSPAAFATSATYGFSSVWARPCVRAQTLVLQLDARNCWDLKTARAHSTASSDLPVIEQLGDDAAHDAEVAMMRCPVLSAASRTWCAVCNRSC